MLKTKIKQTGLKVFIIKIQAKLKIFRILSITELFLNLLWKLNYIALDKEKQPICLYLMYLAKTFLIFW